MTLAALLTLLAFTGIVLGVLLGQPRRLSAHLGAAGGGLLLGLAAFWLLPEIASDLGWIRSLLLATGICAFLLVLDRSLMHSSFSVGQNVAAPLLIVTAIHSFLDGWSVRAAATGSVASVAVPLGLALHKFPEGLALGWIARRRFQSPLKAIAAGAIAELFTLSGALVEPRSELFGILRFGFWWSAAILGIIAGTFAFLGVHALWPARRERAALAVFLATLLIVGCAARLR